MPRYTSFDKPKKKPVRTEEYLLEKIKKRSIKTRNSNDIDEKWAARAKNFKTQQEIAGIRKLRANPMGASKE